MEDNFCHVAPWQIILASLPRPTSLSFSLSITEIRYLQVYKCSLQLISAEGPHDIFNCELR